MLPDETGRWLLAIDKHLRVYVQDARVAYLYATRRSAMDGQLLLRLRGLGTISADKFASLALDTGRPTQELDALVARLQSTDLIVGHRSPHTGELQRVTEQIFTEKEVYSAVADLFEDAAPQPAERVMVPLLDLLSRLPLTEGEILSRLCQQGFSELEVRKALELQAAFGLVRTEMVSALGISILHNEYLWGHKMAAVGPILAGLRRPETDALLALIDEVRSAQGKPLNHLTAAPPHILALAARTGILDTTAITTATGDKQVFAFSPHFYGYRAGQQPLILDDTSDQVKLFVASITYGVTYSQDFRIHSPLQFVGKLLREGEAGNATPILRDYPLLEKHGIVAVEERSMGRGTFVLQKRDIVQQAFDVMSNGYLVDDGRGPIDARTLVSQRHFDPPEVSRLIGDFARQAGATKQFEDELLASVREAAQGGNW
jgi:hypothetical protein